MCVHLVILFAMVLKAAYVQDSLICICIAFAVRTA